MDRVGHLSTSIGHLQDVVEECFDLADDILSDGSIPEPIDKAVVLYEVIGKLRGQIERLQLLRYRMENERAEDGKSNDKSGA